MMTFFLVNLGLLIISKAVTSQHGRENAQYYRTETACKAEVSQVFVGYAVALVVEEVDKISLDVGYAGGVLHETGVLKMKVKRTVVKIYRADNCALVI